MSIKFSVIIPCYNASKHINSLTKSITSSDILPDEIIFVNDCSTDDTLKLLEDLILEKVKKIVVSTKVNSGPGEARNLGVKNSSNENLIFLDSDTRITPNLFRIYLSKIEKYNAVVGIYHFKSLNKNFFQEIKSFYYYFMLYKKFDYKYSIFSSSCAGIKKSFFNKINGFDNWFGINKIDYENEDFGKRLSKITNIWMVPEMQVYHYFPDNFRLFKTLFLRTSHWVEDFIYNKEKKFDEAGGTRQKGFKSILSFLIFILFIINSLFMFNFFILNIVFFALVLLSIYTNIQFLKFVKQKSKSMFKFLIGLIFFDTVIVLGAVYGLLKIMLKISKFKKKYV
tara:strand:- start:8 stop:1024 length:1017 start_codon:yes stop_codon:yes gene_type:complete